MRYQKQSFIEKDDTPLFCVGTCCRFPGFLRDCIHRYQDTQPGKKHHIYGGDRNRYAGSGGSTDSSILCGHVYDGNANRQKRGIPIM